MSALLQQTLQGGAEHAAVARKAILLRSLALATAGNEGAPHDDELAAMLAPLLCWRTQEVIAQASPFLWLNVERMHDACARSASVARPDCEEDPTRTAVGHLLMSAFDVLAGSLPAGEVWSVPLAPGERVVLPTLGITQPAYGRRTQFSRESLPRPGSLSTPGVSGTRARVLAAADAALFEDAYREQILSSDASGFAAQIAAALRLVDEALPETAARISEGIAWYVPIASPDAATHCSFSSPRLDGVAFLSPTPDSLRLAEAIVHEYGHMELDRLMAVVPMTGDVGPEERFYSPWRPDARPMTGLLHALHVFREVLRLLERLVCVSGTSAEPLHARMRGVAHRLNCGLAQVPRSRIDSLGADLIDEISRDLRDVVLRNPWIGGSAPPEVERHLSAWCVAHPALANTVVHPGDLGGEAVS